MIQISEAIPTSEYIPIEEAETLFMDIQFQQLTQSISTKWTEYQQEIQSVQESISIVSGQNPFSKTLEKQGITVELNESTSFVKFSREDRKSHGEVKSEATSAQEKSRMSQQIEALKETISKQEAHILSLVQEVQTKSLEINSISASSKGEEQKLRKQTLRFQNQNRLLIEQVNRLKCQLSSSSKSLNKTFTEKTPTDRPSVVHSSVQTEPSNDLEKNDESEMDETMGEENKYLRDMIGGLTEELESLRRENGQMKQSRTSNSSYGSPTEIINLKNKVATLESTNKILEHQREKIKKELFIKDAQIKSLSAEIRLVQMETPVKKGGEAVGRLATEGDRGDTLVQKQGDSSSKAIVQLRNQNRQLLIKLDTERRERTNLIQKHQSELTKLTSDFRLVSQQKTSLQNQLTNAKTTTSSTPTFSQQESDRKIKQLQSQLLHLTNERNTNHLSNNNRYVASSSYEFLKESTDKERKSFGDVKEKLKAEINELKVANNRLVGEGSALRNQKQRAESQLSRAQGEVNKLKGELQSARKDNDNITRKLKHQEYQLHNSKVSRSYEASPRNSDRDNYQHLNQEIISLRAQNDSMRQAITQYKHLLNSRNLAAMNQKLYKYESQLKQKTSYIKILVADVRDRDDKIDSLESDLYRVRQSPQANSSRESLEWSYQKQFQYSQKTVEKLSEQIKQIKVFNSNLQGELGDKEKIIHVLNQRISELSSARKHNGKIQYHDLMTFSKDKEKSGNRVSSASAEELRDHVEMYKNKYEKAFETNNYLRECLFDFKKTSTCNLCLEYQNVVVELQRRINIYEVMMMGELRRLFLNCETRLSTNYTWMEMETIIADLRSRTINHRPVSQNYSSTSRSIDRFAEQSPISARVLIDKSPKSFTRSQRSDLIKNDVLDLECMSILMLRIVEGVINAKGLKFLLPDCVYVLYLDSSNPERMKIELVENRQLLGEEYKVYLSPQVLNGGQHTQQSLVWNLGILFNLILTRKNYFLTPQQITSKSLPFKYASKEAPGFKEMIEGMLEKSPEKRLGMEHVRTALVKEILLLKK